MEKDRDKRYQSALQFSRDLTAFANGEDIRARRVGAVGRTWRQVKRHKIRSSLAAALALAVIGAGLLAFQAARVSARQAERDYEDLCARAYAGNSSAWRRSGASDELFGRAIALLPGRQEAYVGRALLGTSPEQALADIEEARRLGLPARSYHLLRADAHRRQGRWSEVAAEDRQAGPELSGVPLDLVVEGKIAWLRGEYDHAEACLTRAIEMASSEWTRHLARTIRGLSRETRGELDGALEDLLALPGSDRVIWIRVFVAAIWRALGRAERADVIMEGLLREQRAAGEEARWTAVLDACWTAVELGPWLERISSEAVDAFGGSAVLATHRAAALNQSRDFDGALLEAQRALALDPDLDLAHEEMGQALHELGRVPEALAAFKRMRRTPRSATQMSGCLAELGRFDEALDLLGRARKNSPYHWSVPSYVAQVYSERGDQKKALAASDDALRLAPRLWFLHSDRGLYLRRAGRNTEALDAYDRALTLQPRDVVSLANRVGPLLQLGRRDEALASADRAIEIDQNYGVAHAARADALNAVGRHDEALKSSLRAVELGGPHVELAHNAHSVTLGELGRDAEALAAADRAVQYGGSVDRTSRWLRSNRRFNSTLETLSLCTTAPMR